MTHTEDAREGRASLHVKRFTLFLRRRYHLILQDPHRFPFPVWSAQQMRKFYLMVANSLLGALEGESVSSAPSGHLKMHFELVL